MTGWICHHFFNEGEQLEANRFLFQHRHRYLLRLIKMIIAPLVFATIVWHCVNGQINFNGSITLKSMTWFITASFVSLAIGMGLANFFQPGAALDLALPTAQQLSSSSLPTTTGFTLQSFLSHVFPRSIAEAMANNDILQVLVFSFSLVQLLLFVNQGKEKTQLSFA